MIAGRSHERRDSKSTDLNLRLSFLFHVPEHIAWVIVTLGLTVTATAEILMDKEIWFGPAYLLVITFTAWTISSRIAIALGFLVIAIHWAARDFAFYPYPYGQNYMAWNFAMRFVVVLIVVGMLAIARESLEREWRLARTDLLTGALNRQAFFETIQNQVDEEGWYVLTYADLDGLKRLNDEKGHDLGDQSLKGFSKCVKKCIRKGDLFARIGGDEFVIFMKVRDEEAGNVVAQRLDQAINLQDSDDDNRLRCSLGVLILPPGPRSIDVELKLADKLMYAAKQAGGGLSLATAQYQSGGIQLAGPLGQETVTERSQVLRGADRQALA